MSSCSDKGYWEQAPIQNAYSFQSPQYNETLDMGAHELVIPIDRSNNSGEQTLDIKFTPGKNCPTDISVPSQVKFEAGSNVANLIINIANATPPYTYSGYLTFNGEKSYAGNDTLRINCPVNYTWSTMGTGTFLDAWVMGDINPYPVQILKADGFERYRVLSPYAEFYKSETAEEIWGDWISRQNGVLTTGPAYVEFWENSNQTLSFTGYDTGLNYEGVDGQPIGVYPWNWSDFETIYGLEYAEGFDIWYEPGFAVLSPVYFIPNLGGFGQIQYSIQIELPID